MRSRSTRRARTRMSRGSSSRRSSARAGTQAARHRSGRRRRLRLEDLHLRRGDGLRLGGQENRPAGQMDGGENGIVPGGRARPRPRVARRTRARRQRQDRRLARPYDRQPRRLSLDVRVVGADLPLRDPVVRPVRHPGHLLRGRRGLHQHRAGRRLSRRRPAGGDLRCRASGREGGPRDGPRSGRVPAPELRQDVSAPDAGHPGL